MTKPLTMQERILLREGMIVKRFFDAGTGQMSAAKIAEAFDDALIEAERRINALEKALKPFADEAERYEPDEGDDSTTAWATSFDIGYLRRARAALKGKE